MAYAIIPKVIINTFCVIFLQLGISEIELAFLTDIDPISLTTPLALSEVRRVEGTVGQLR